MDYAHEWTDGEISKLERAMAREYGQAAREMRSKLDRHLAKHEEKLKKMRARLAAGEITDGEMRDWLADQAMDRRYLQDMVSSLSGDADRARERAMALVEDRIPRIYAENADYGAFEVDRAARLDTRFNLMDEDTARQLIGRGEALFEPPRPNAAKVRAWTDRKLTSAITQGILQGESIPHISKRLRSVCEMSLAASVRTARTACTGAENAGRVSSYQRAERLGIELRQEWLATLDSRTRDSHRLLDCERIEVGETFSNGCRFPGDPQGPAREVYNCRCTLVAAVDGVDQDAAARFQRLPDGMTYEEWREQARARMAGQQVGEPPVAGIPEPRYGVFRGLSYVEDGLGSHWGDGSDLDPRLMIMRDTGFDEARAEQVRRDVSSWVGQGYRKIRLEEGDYALTADRLDEFIAASPKYRGTVYRGIGVERSTADDMLEALRGGGSIDNHGIASWATESDWATEFMSMNSEELDDPVGIVFQLDENRSGASIKHIADIDNDEVVAPRGVRYELAGEVETVVDPYEGEYLLVHVREVS